MNTEPETSVMPQCTVCDSNETVKRLKIGPGFRCYSCNTKFGDMQKDDDALTRPTIGASNWCMFCENDGLDCYSCLSTKPSGFRVRR
jgi:hypothetical protein